MSSSSAGCSQDLGQQGQSRDANAGSRSQETPVHRCHHAKAAVASFPSAHTCGLVTSPNAKPRSGVMGSTGEATLLAGTSPPRLHRAEGRLARCAEPQLGTGVLGTAERTRERWARRSRSPLTSPAAAAAAAHPVFPKSGCAKLPASKICLRNKAGDCWPQLPPSSREQKALPSPLPAPR